MERTAYILCPAALQSRLYGWLDRLEMPVQVVSGALSQWQLPADAGILITHCHYRWEELAVLRRVVDQQRVPVLVLADGILEYRNTWENPGIAPGVLFQPLVGHKLACIGRAQARWVESWGNPECCEVIGLPHLDGVTASAARPATGPWRLLVATARTPAFTDAQRQRVVEGLQAIRAQVPPQLGGRPVELVWRLSAGLEVDLGMPPVPEDVDLPPLSGVLESVDAVITTPSTLYLESVRREKPTAVLDFHRCPPYVPAAWTITSADQVAETVSQLADPPAPRLEFQRFTLHEQLECSTPATPRMLRLVQQLVELGEAARHQGTPLQLPGRLIPLESGPWPSDLEPNIAFPDHPAFADREVARLQVELAAAIARLKGLPDEVAHLSESNERLRKRVRELHERVKNLRARFGVQPLRESPEGP